MIGVRQWGKGSLQVIHNACELAARERQRLLAEIGAVSGLMPLLMKPRNNQKWTRKEKVLLRRHLKRLSALSPYLALVVLPGGFIVLPALAWWLDRRRDRARREPQGLKSAERR